MASDKIRKLLTNASDRQNLSRRALAFRMKVPPQSVNNWIDSEMNPSNASLKKIAAYFNVTVADLMDDRDNHMPAPTPPPPHSDLLIKALMDRLDEMSKRLDEMNKRLQDVILEGELKRSKPSGGRG